MLTDFIGKAKNRVDGREKVTGKAKYAAEYSAPDLTYGYVLSSDIAKGRISKMDTSEALKIPGVLQVFTHENRPGLAWFDSRYQDQDAPPGSPFRPLHNNKIMFNLQPIGLVVAETYELARFAAMLVKIEYEEQPHETDLFSNIDKAYHPKKYKSTPPPKEQGDAQTALQNSAVKIEVEYTHPSEHHNPMEMHASTVVWENDGSLTVYDKTQGVANSKKYICDIFGLSKNKVKVLSPYVGGAFGSGLRPQYQLFLATMAATELKRSVKVVLTRQQMFSFGHRPATLQKVALGASEDGTLTSVIHEAFGETSQFEDYSENVIVWSGAIYKSPNIKVDYKLVGLDVYTPLDMRAPGGVTGMYALESAMDELSYATGVDPLELRLKNYTEKDQFQDLPFSSKELKACYTQAAERFGWSKRNPLPRSTKEGHNLIGWGMATGLWETTQKPSDAKAVLSSDGKLRVSSATSDIGTGTYTIMTQIAAETLGLPLEDVTFDLGDSSLPKAPLEGGSWTASSVGSAVKMVCTEVGVKLLKCAKKMHKSTFANAGIEDVEFVDSLIRLKGDPSTAISITELMKNCGLNLVEEEVSAKPSKEQENYAMYTHSAVFVEVKVDEDLGTIKVSRVVSAIAGGRILNPKTAENQILGGVVWGIGMALQEESVMDNNFGRFMNHNLAEYHVPVNADIHDIEVIFVEENDDIVNPIGVKGLGEIGIIGVAAAIGNAVYHATGKRIRELPILLDKVM